MLIGIGVLTRPTFIFFLPVYFLYIGLSSKRFKYAFKVILTVALYSILVILPWTIRNYQIHKRWIFITTNTPEYFWRGNNPVATGTALTKDKQDILAKAPKEFRDKLLSMSEMQQYDFFLKTTLGHIKTDPAFFIKMCFKKLFYFWWFTPTIGILYPNSWAFVYKIYYSFIFIFFVTGFIVSLTKLKEAKRAQALSLFIFCFLTSLLHSVYYIETRHRFSIEALIIIFSSYGFVLACEKLRSSTKRLNTPPFKTG